MVYVRVRSHFFLFVRLFCFGCSLCCSSLSCYFFFFLSFVFFFLEKHVTSFIHRALFFVCVKTYVAILFLLLFGFKRRAFESICFRWWYCCTSNRAPRALERVVLGYLCKLRARVTPLTYAGLRRGLVFCFSLPKRNGVMRRAQTYTRCVGVLSVYL